MLNQTIFCITSDIDWASSFCTENLIALLQDFDITPTLFATHDCPAVRAFQETHPDDVGIHPNFRANSTHGSDWLSVIDHLFALYPTAKAFRSHSFYDSSDILREMSSRGVTHDSNLCLYLQPNIVPLQLGIPGITRFPVFWEDDCHWMHAGGDWDFGSLLDAFTSPGLKIINVHPFIIAANSPSAASYLGVKEHITTLSREDVDNVRHEGPGPRTFLISLLEFAKSRSIPFCTLNQLYHMLPVDSFLVSRDETEGRATKHSDEEYRKYWQMSDAAKQEFLKASYGKRDARDIYATSRDFHARELEIEAIAQGISERGPVLDLGCGNGYTLISLARKLADWAMVGVDFSEHLIEGARFLLGKEGKELRSRPEFICANAVDYVDGLGDESVQYVITERFLQNLPSAAVQRRVVRECYRVLKRGGRFVVCEGAEGGFARLNELRRQVGLSTIPATSSDNVSAMRLVDEEFEEYVQSEVGFTMLRKVGMSNYMIMSRVLHPLMVQPLAPRFDSSFNEVSRRIQEHTEFSPGYGSNVVWILEK